MGTIRHARRYARESFRRRREPGSRPPLELARHFPAWHRSLAPGRTALADRAPWMTYAAARELERVLRPSMTVFEFGSGGSTLFFASLANRVVSVEHDAAWHGLVAEALEVAGRTNCEQRMEPPELVSSDAPVGVYASTDERYTGMSFESYARSVESEPPDSIDVVVLDGRARPACAMHAFDKVAPGGWLVLDNAERAHYAPIRDELSARAWLGRDFSGPGPYNDHFWTTSMWRRPLT